MPVTGIKTETVEELIDTLCYIMREFERDGRVDSVNMIHVYRALRMVYHDRQAAFVAKFAPSIAPVEPVPVSVLLTAE